MNFDTILSDDLIFVKRDYQTANEVITFLSERLLEKGYVKEDFLPAVLEREKKFPTGLYLGSINVAIPHTDVKHVIKQAVTIVTLKNPVKFRKMDNPDEEIPVHIVFLLAIVDPKEYVKFLADLTKSFSDKVFIQKIYDTSSPWQLLNLFKHALQLERQEGFR
ncbi:PTS sugar transporter subunit IIA [Caldisericum sp.]|uniref:PTS sugar transporter subunit IIA n=1 Tax=Caldisericum sp. TaxID=2499687 RepID=UPI003D0F7E53